MIQQVVLIFSYMLINIHENMGNNSNRRKRVYQFESKRDMDGAGGRGA